MSSNMPDFSVYQHIESVVEAVQMAADTTSFILKSIILELSGGFVTSFHMEFDRKKSTYEITFTYDGQLPQTIRTSDYLVRLNNGSYTVISEDEFKAAYMEGTHGIVGDEPIVDTARADYTAIAA